MFIVACFSRETRNTTATSEEVTTLAREQPARQKRDERNDGGRHRDGEPKPHSDRLGAKQ